ncbi:MAG TPA: alpha/beta hydrolase, partial [Terrimicrobiaceae bacterium]
LNGQSRRLITAWFTVRIRVPPFLAWAKSAVVIFFCLPLSLAGSSLSLMRFQLRVLAKVSFLLGVLVLLVVGLMLARAASWRADKLALLDSASEIAQTERGEVEYLIRGQGPAILIFHGAPGGYDQATLLGSFLAEEEFEIAAPSRPGYLRTPLATGQSPEEQAQAMAAFIDTMGIPSVAVLASSAGTPAAIQFVLRYPQKAWALILLSAVTKRRDLEIKLPWTEPERYGLDVFAQDLRAWLSVGDEDEDPRKILGQILEAENGGTIAQREALASYILNDSDQLEWVQSLLGTFVPPSVRQLGLKNDILQIRALEEFPLEQITVPTLMVHGTSDRIVPFSEAEAAAGRIPGAIFYPVAGAGHLVEIGPQASDVQAKIIQFLREHSDGQP